MSYGQCFICREWSWDAQSRFSGPGVRLCMPCWSECLDTMTETVLRERPPAEPGGGLREGPDEPVLPRI